MIEPEAHIPVTDKRAKARAAHDKTLYEALEALPENLTGEIPRGQLHTQPRPAPSHALAAFKLGGLLRDPYALGRGGPGEWWILLEPEVHFLRDTEIAVPDLAGWQRVRMPEVPSDHRFEVVPDRVCEILSPATRSKDREIKMPLYARHNEDGEWLQAAVFGASDTVAAAPFDAAAFRVADLWN